ncbi:MAG TPA: hypothetical protein P5074_15355, partial [Candidatus Nanopelagicales bacterium]|nr:hypothetical protein [Candidatus Nanopelagicales bacterium]
VLGARSDARWDVVWLHSTPPGDSSRRPWAELPHSVSWRGSGYCLLHHRLLTGMGSSSSPR